MTATLRIAVVYPDLLGTYGDGGNGLILARRAQWRGVEVELLQAPSDAPAARGRHLLPGWRRGRPAGACGAVAHRGRNAAPACRRRRRRAGGLRRLSDRRAELSGRGRDAARRGRPARHRHGQGRRRTSRGRGGGGGERGPAADPDRLREPRRRDDAGRRERCPWRWSSGAPATGTGPPPRARSTGRVLGTYLHGPVLARNPALADLLLAWALDSRRAGPPRRRGPTDALRQERLGAAGVDPSPGRPSDADAAERSHVMLLPRDRATERRVAAVARLAREQHAAGDGPAPDGWPPPPRHRPLGVPRRDGAAGARPRGGSSSRACGRPTTGRRRC